MQPSPASWRDQALAQGSGWVCEVHRLGCPFSAAFARLTAGPGASAGRSRALSVKPCLGGTRHWTPTWRSDGTWNRAQSETAWPWPWRTGPDPRSCLLAAGDASSPATGGSLSLGISRDRTTLGFPKRKPERCRRRSERRSALAAGDWTQHKSLARPGSASGAAQHWTCRTHREQRDIPATWHAGNRRAASSSRCPPVRLRSGLCRVRGNPATMDAWLPGPVVFGRRERW